MRPQDAEDLLQPIVDRANAQYAAGLDWITFYGIYLGPHGEVAQLCASQRDREIMAASAGYQQLRNMLRDLRSTWLRGKKNGRMKTMITVRLPQEVRDMLKHEARWRGMSLNQLCVDKILG